MSYKLPYKILWMEKKKLENIIKILASHKDYGTITVATNTKNVYEIILGWKKKM